MDFTKGTYAIEDVFGELAEVRIEDGGATVLVKWVGDDEFVEDDDGMEMLVNASGDFRVKKISDD